MKNEKQMIKECPQCLKPAKIKCDCGCYQEDGIWYNSDDLPMCPVCHGLMRTIHDNVGFTAPDPEKFIITGFECNDCGITINA